MTILQSGVTLPIQISAGQTLVVKDLTGVSSVVGSISNRKDASRSIGNGFFVYGPQRLNCTVTLSTTGICDYQIVQGDATKSGGFVSYEINPETDLPELLEPSLEATARSISGGAPANSVITKYGITAAGGSWGNTCATNITIGTTALTHSLTNERPRFETYTRKCLINSAASEIRFASANFTADQTEKAFSIDVYIEQMPSEFLAPNNPYIVINISNTTSLGANYSRWTFGAQYLRQGWNTLKLRQADTVSAVAGVGNLPTGVDHNTDVGTGFDWTGTGQFLGIAFNNMAGFTVHLDQLRRPAKAFPVLTIGFDACGFNATDELPVTKVAPLLARYGIRSYCTLTNIYELIYSGTQAWRRLSNLCNNFGWDAVNHTWSHGATEVGRVLTATSASRASNVVTFNVSTGHSLVVNKVAKVSIQDSTAITMTAGTPGTVNWANHKLAAGSAVSFSGSAGVLPPELTSGTTYYVLASGLVANTSFQVATTPGGTAINFTSSSTGTINPGPVAVDATVTSTTAFTYASTGVDGSLSNLKAYTFLSEVIASNTTENQRILDRELVDITTVQRGNGFSSSAPWIAYPNNSVPELNVLQTSCNKARIRMGRGYRGGFTFVNEFGADNPLNMGSFIMDSGSIYLRLSELKAKVQAAIDRGDHIHIFGHFLLDDEDPANPIAVVDPDYPPGQGGNPAPPAAGLSGIGGWYYYSQFRKLIEETVGPAIQAGTLKVMSPREYTAFMGFKEQA